MSSDDPIFESFKAFVAFGDRGHSDSPQPLIDGKKFVKLCRDCGIIDAGFTSVDADIIFANNNVKAKNERKIPYAQFLTALQLIADRKGVDVQVIYNLVASGNPQLNGAALPDNDEILTKMTDVSLYTGIHRERFNADGTGRGKEGRDSPSKTSTPNDERHLSYVTNRSLSAKKLDFGSASPPRK